jgi:dolichyl-phosphate beta-glucosyltransferase
MTLMGGQSARGRRAVPAELDLSVIIPAYNEEQRLPRTMESIIRYLDRQPIRYEIGVVDDGSADRTCDIVRRYAQDHPRVVLMSYGSNRGKGFAVRYGMMRGRGERLLLSDADLSTPIEEIEKLSAWLDEGYDIAIGSRALPGSNLPVRQSFLRERVGRSFNFVVRTVSGLSFADTQCGFKLFSRDAAMDVFPLLTIDRWSFDVEALFVAQRMGYRTKEVPITWIDAPGSKVSVGRDLVRTMTDLTRIRTRWAFRNPYRVRARLTSEDLIGTTGR